MTETILALDGIAIIVNPDNPVNDLDLETIGRESSVLLLVTNTKGRCTT